ncbi:Sodium- and chloride-dependent GABA transporter 2 [Liparis tanakae]|uniref:Sodium-and chloride-dependent GABA transporter 2 n=1 Tax=Liparis tanakae TaxID=230148 RepID=A0A4Z2J4G1_9TELE|nr:Sodium- and chloride-dependent GABA transporter 2 [Liparis tanakae]
MSEKQGVDISLVAESGPGLVFIVYPQAVTLLPWPQVWSVCFFTMIILLGIDGQFIGLESIMTSLSDVYPSQIRKGFRRELLLMLICASGFGFGLLLVSQGTLVFLLLRYTPMRFNNSYVYPWWAYCIGWFLATSSVMMIPVTMVWKLSQVKGTLWQRLKMSSQPAGDYPVGTTEIESTSTSLHFPDVDKMAMGTKMPIL